MDTFQHIVPSIQTPHLTLEYLPFRLTNNKLHHPKYHTPQHRTSSPTPHPASLEPHSAPRVQEAPFALTILNRSPARKRHHAKLIGLASGEQTQRERSSKSTEPLSSANLHLRRPQTPLPSPCSDGAFACARGGVLGVAAGTCGTNACRREVWRKKALTTGKHGQGRGGFDSRGGQALFVRYY